jgi:hypothetical protein
MRGDQLARQWRIIREIEASPDGLAISEITNREEMGVRTIYRDPEALQIAGFPLYNEKVENANCWAFVDKFVSAAIPLCRSIFSLNQNDAYSAKPQRSFHMTIRLSQRA